MSRRFVAAADALEYAAAGDLAWIVVNRRWPRRQLLIEVRRDDLLSWAEMVVHMEQPSTVGESS